jgi:hypothetical protein
MRDVRQLRACLVFFGRHLAFPQFSVLRSVVIPPVSGVWANTVAAYETLPPLLRALADQLWALHSDGCDYAHPNATARELPYRETVFKSTNYESEHPVGQVHPRTGERAISLGNFCSQASRRQCDRRGASVCDAAGSRDAAMWRSGTIARRRATSDASCAG